LTARWMTLLAGAVVIAVVAAGCGDGDSTAGSPDSQSDGGSGGGTVSESSLSKAEYIKKAGAACRREREDLVGEASIYFAKHPSKGKQQGAVVADMARAVMVPTIEAEMAIVRETGAPKGDGKQIEEILRAEQEAVDEVKEQDEVQSIQAVLDYFGAVNNKYRDYGFTSCLN
jgi:hypothetical protein